MGRPGEKDATCRPNCSDGQRPIVSRRISICIASCAVLLASPPVAGQTALELSEIAAIRLPKGTPIVAALLEDGGVATILDSGEFLRSSRWVGLDTIQIGETDPIAISGGSGHLRFLDGNTLRVFEVTGSVSVLADDEGQCPAASPLIYRSGGVRASDGWYVVEIDVVSSRVYVRYRDDRSCDWRIVLTSEPDAEGQAGRLQIGAVRADAVLVSVREPLRVVRIDPRGDTIQVIILEPEALPDGRSYVALRPIVLGGDLVVTLADIASTKRLFLFYDLSTGQLLRSAALDLPLVLTDASDTAALGVVRLTGYELIKYRLGPTAGAASSGPPRPHGTTEGRLHY